MNPTTNLTITHNNEKINLYFGNNTLKKFLDLNGVDDINDLDKVLAKNPLDFFPKLLHSAYEVACKKEGIDSNKDLDRWGFIFDELDDKDLAEVWDMFNASINRLGKLMGQQKAPQKNKRK